MSSNWYKRIKAQEAFNLEYDIDPNAYNGLTPNRSSRKPQENQLKDNPLKNPEIVQELKDLAQWRNLSYEMIIRAMIADEVDIANEQNVWSWIRGHHREPR